MVSALQETWDQFPDQTLFFEDSGLTWDLSHARLRFVTAFGWCKLSESRVCSEVVSRSCRPESGGDRLLLNREKRQGKKSTEALNFVLNPWHCQKSIIEQIIYLKEVRDSINSADLLWCCRNLLYKFAQRLQGMLILSLFITIFNSGNFNTVCCSIPESSVRLRAGREWMEYHHLWWKHSDFVVCTATENADSLFYEETCGVVCLKHFYF